MKKEYTTYSINLVGVGCEDDLLPIHIRTLDPDLFDDLKNSLKNIINILKIKINMYLMDQIILKQHKETIK